MEPATRLSEVRRLMSEGKGEDAISRALQITRHQARKLVLEVERADGRQVALAAPEATGGLIKYEAACRALAEAISVDEVMQIRDQAEMLQAAGRIADKEHFEAFSASGRRLGGFRSAPKTLAAIRIAAAEMQGDIP